MSLNHIALVCGPRCVENGNVEIDDDKLGFVASLDLNPQKARILTQLLIANGTVEPRAIQQVFEER